MKELSEMQIRDLYSRDLLLDKVQGPLSGRLVLINLG